MNFGQNQYYPLHGYEKKKEEWFYLAKKEAKPFTDQLSDLINTPTSLWDDPPEFRTESFFLDNLVLDRNRVDLLTRHLFEREEIKKSHMNEIDKTMCYCQGKIWELNAWYQGKNKGVDQTRNLLVTKIIDLQHDKRSEENAAWRDQSSLLKDFFEAWGTYHHDRSTAAFIDPVSKVSQPPPDDTPTDSRKM